MEKNVSPQHITFILGHPRGRQSLELLKLDSIAQKTWVKKWEKQDNLKVVICLEKTTRWNRSLTVSLTLFIKALPACSWKNDLRIMMHSAPLLTTLMLACSPNNMGANPCNRQDTDRSGTC